MEAVLRARLGGAADAPLSSVSWGATRRPRGAPRPHLCLVSHLASRNPSATFLLRSYNYAAHAGAAGIGIGGGGGVGGGGGGIIGASSSASSTLPPSGPGIAGGARLAGDSGLSLLDSLRATSAAPWYLEEVVITKDLCTGDVYGPGKRPPPDAITAAVRLIDGGISCNNPTDVAIHEARQLFGRERPLLVVSVGTGGGAAAEMTPNGYFPLWLQHLVNATGDVADTDATVRHLLSPHDAYFRFHPVADAFGCGLDDARPENLSALTAAAEAFMDDEAAHLAVLVAALVPRA
jgi:hypothetical protein